MNKKYYGVLLITATFLSGNAYAEDKGATQEPTKETETRTIEEPRQTTGSTTPTDGKENRGVSTASVARVLEPPRRGRNSDPSAPTNRAADSSDATRVPAGVDLTGAQATTFNKDTWLLTTLPSGIHMKPGDTMYTTASGNIYFAGNPNPYHKCPNGYIEWGTSK